MKRILLTAILALASAAAVSAQHIGETRFGVLGGFTSTNAQGNPISDVKGFDASKVALYHVGVTAQIPMALGISLQPSLSWQMKGATLDSYTTTGDVKEITSTLNAKVGYLELAAQVQYGLDLLLFKPYLLAEPFVGYAMSVNETVSQFNKVTNAKEVQQQVKAFANSALPRVEYGLGIGAGIEFWQMQLAFKYFWNFGNLYDGKNYVTGEQVSEQVKGAFENGKSFNGFNISLTLFLF
ncbi:MAG: PorT family protein [Bacteroidales bacterium]|nr:PorT family protein [Bacteroidales bacterium]